MEWVHGWIHIRKKANIEVCAQSNTHTTEIFMRLAIMICGCVVFSLLMAYALTPVGMLFPRVLIAGVAGGILGLALVFSQKQVKK
jgi:hypothetical protein